MRSGYKVIWTDHALQELRNTFQYLELNFSDKEINRLAVQIESVLGHISVYPKLYPESPRKQGVRREVVSKFNTLYYRVRVKKRQIEIVSFFSNRQDPKKLKL